MGSAFDARNFANRHRHSRRLCVRSGARPRARVAGEAAALARCLLRDAAYLLPGIYGRRNQRAAGSHRDDQPFGDWTALRNRWELSHVLRAALAGVSLVALVIAVA